MEETLHTNFDEIAALTAELGGGMDSMFSDLMASLAPNNADDKCNLLIERIKSTKLRYENRANKIRSLPSSPSKYAEHFEDTLTELQFKLDQMLLKCKDIPTMSLPMFQITTIEEELDEMETVSIQNGINKTFARRLSFQVALQSTEEAKRKIYLRHQEQELEEKLATLVSDTSSGEEDDEEEKEREEENRIEQSTEPTDQIINQAEEMYINITHKEEAYDEKVVEAARAALENNAMSIEESDQLSCNDTFWGIDALKSTNSVTGWRENTRMKAEEKLQCSYSDTFFGLDRAVRLKQEQDISQLETKNMRMEEDQQLALNDAFWGIDVHRLKLLKSKEEALQNFNLNQMQLIEIEQCRFHDNFYGIDLEKQNLARKERKKLLLKMTRSITPTRPTSREDLVQNIELHNMIQEEHLQIALGDCFFGLDKKYNDAGIKIVQFRKRMVRKRRLKSSTNTARAVLSKHMEWSLLAKQRKEKVRHQLLLNEKQQRMEYMQSFYTLSGSDSSFGGDGGGSVSTFGSTIAPLYTPNKRNSKNQNHNNMRKSQSDSTFSSSSSLSPTKRKRKKRNDHLISLESPNRVGGTFASDHVKLKKLRDNLWNSKKNVYLLGSLRREQIRQRQKFTRLKLPQVGLGVEARRRRRVVSGKVHKMNGKVQTTMIEKRKQERERHVKENWSGEYVYGSLESYAQSSSPTPSFSPSPPKKINRRTTITGKKKKIKKKKKTVNSKRKIHVQKVDTFFPENETDNFGSSLWWNEPGDEDGTEGTENEENLLSQGNRYQEARKKLRRDDGGEKFHL